MRIGMIGLGKMGGNMARRLLRKGIEVAGYNRSAAVVKTLQTEEGLLPAASLHDLVSQLSTPRIIWLMLPAGSATEQTIHELAGMLEAGDIVVDGGNANYHDSQHRAAFLAGHDVGFIDAGTSGGVWGLENGYCMMVGGSEAAVAQLEPVLKALAPAEDRGWAHMGPVGAGHYTKMVHNGIEYGMMQAFAEGFDLMRSKAEFNLDLAKVAETWRHASVVRSWLLDLTAEALAQQPDMSDIAAIVPDSGEGRWTAIEAVEQGVPLPVISLALQMRFASQDTDSYQGRILSVMRNAFGGHEVIKK
ncbi:MAG: phosphogluconate dehydrogenase (NAD(+)-dependent, decarboxylating) [Thiohalomonadaceae bacterium]